MNEYNIWGANTVPMYAAPTAEQVALMTDPRALVIARRIAEWADQKPAKTFYRYLELVACEPIPGISEDALKFFLTSLLETGLLIEKRNQSGTGSYFVPSPNTWPWTQCVLADHKET